MKIQTKKPLMFLLIALCAASLFLSIISAEKVFAGNISDDGENLITDRSLWSLNSNALWQNGVLTVSGEQGALFKRQVSSPNHNDNVGVQTTVTAKLAFNDTSSGHVHGGKGGLEGGGILLYGTDSDVSVPVNFSHKGAFSGMEISPGWGNYGVISLVVQGVKYTKVLEAFPDGSVYSAQDDESKSAELNAYWGAVHEYKIDIINWYVDGDSQKPIRGDAAITLSVDGIAVYSLNSADIVTTEEIRGLEEWLSLALRSNRFYTGVTAESGNSMAVSSFKINGEYVNLIIASSSNWSLTNASFAEGGILTHTNGTAIFNKKYLATENFPDGGYKLLNIAVSGIFADTSDGHIAAGGGAKGSIEGGEILVLGKSQVPSSENSNFMRFKVSPGWGDYGVIAMAAGEDAEGYNAEIVLSAFPDGTTYTQGATEEQKAEQRDAYWGAAHKYEINMLVAHNGTDFGGWITLAFKVDGNVIANFWGPFGISPDSFPQYNSSQRGYYGFMAENGNSFTVSDYRINGLSAAGRDASEDWTGLKLNSINYDGQLISGFNPYRSSYILLLDGKPDAEKFAVQAESGYTIETFWNEEGDTATVTVEYQGAISQYTVKFIDSAPPQFEVWQNSPLDRKNNLINDVSMWNYNYGQGIQSLVVSAPDYLGTQGFVVKNSAGAAYTQKISAQNNKYTVKLNATLVDTNGTSTHGGTGLYEGGAIMLMGADINSSPKTEGANTDTYIFNSSHQGNYLSVVIAPIWGEYGVIGLKSASQSNIADFVLNSFGDYTFPQGIPEDAKTEIKNAYWSIQHTYIIEITLNGEDSFNLEIFIDGNSIGVSAGLSLSGLNLTSPGYFALFGDTGNDYIITEFGINNEEIYLSDSWQPPVISDGNNLITTSDNFSVALNSGWENFYSYDSSKNKLTLDSMISVTTSIVYAPQKIGEEDITLTYKAMLTQPSPYGSTGENGIDWRTRYASFGIVFRRFPNKSLTQVNGTESNPLVGANGNGYYLSLSTSVKDDGVTPIGRIELMKPGKLIAGVADHKKWLTSVSFDEFDKWPCNGEEHTIVISTENIEGGVLISVFYDGKRIIRYADIAIEETSSNYVSGTDNQAAGYAGIFYSNELRMFTEANHQKVGDQNAPGKDDYFIIKQFAIGNRVNVKPVEGIEITSTKALAEDGKLYLTDADTSVRLTATVLPEDAFNKNIVWESSNRNIVSVAGSGTLIVLGAGTAVITCTTESGNHVASLTVVVTLENSQPVIESGYGCNGSTGGTTLFVLTFAVLIFSAFLVLHKKIRIVPNHYAIWCPDNIRLKRCRNDKAL